MAEHDAHGIPFCNTCRHYHTQGVACPQCGHIGRSNIFTKMKLKATAHTKLSLWSCGNGCPDGCDLSSQHDQWAILREFRGNQYRIDSGKSIEEEFNVKEERDSRHLLWSIGDKPVVTTRYQLRLSEVGDVACIMDRFVYMPGYLEREGLAEKLIQAWIEDAKQVSLLLLHERQSIQSATQAQGPPAAKKFYVHIPEAFTGVVSILQHAGFAVTATQEGMLQLLQQAGEGKRKREGEGGCEEG